MSGDELELVGIVREEHRGGVYAIDVEIGGTTRRVLARLSGRLVTRRIRVTVGDSVTVGLSPYDMSRGRITYRNSGRTG